MIYGPYSLSLDNLNINILCGSLTLFFYYDQDMYRARQPQHGDTVSMCIFTIHILHFLLMYQLMEA